MNKRRRFIAKRRRAWKRTPKWWMTERWAVMGDKVGPGNLRVPIRFPTVARTEREANKLAGPASEVAMYELGISRYTWAHDAVVLYCM